MSKLCASTLRCARSICARQHAALDDLAFLHAGRLQPALGALGIAEDAHQVVFERQVEAARARIALAAGAAAQLVVDAARLVALGADDVQAAGGDHRVVALLPVASRTRALSASAASSPQRVRARLRAMPPSTMSVPRPAMLVAIVTAPGRPACATIVRLALVLLGVQHLVRDAVLLAAGPTATPRSRSRSCRPAPAGRASYAVLDVLDDRVDTCPSALR